MSISLTSENKNSISLSFESKSHDERWEDETMQWGQNHGTWGIPGVSLVPENKNSVSLNFESKN